MTHLGSVEFVFEWCNCDFDPILSVLALTLCMMHSKVRFLFGISLCFSDFIRLLNVVGVPFQRQSCNPIKNLFGYVFFTIKYKVRVKVMFYWDSIVPMCRNKPQSTHLINICRNYWNNYYKIVYENTFYHKRLFKSSWWRCVMAFQCHLSFRSLWKTTPGGPFYKHGLTLIPAWISNYINYKVWDKITYPPSNFNVQPLKLRNGKVMSFHNLLGMWLLIHAGI